MSIQKLFTTLILLCISLISIHAQQNILWSEPDASISYENESILFEAEEFELFHLDTSSIQAIIFSAPQEENTSVKNSSSTLDVPIPEHGTMSFKIVNYAMMEDGLAARYPTFKTGYGVSTQKPYATIRYDWTATGFHAVITTKETRYFIDPYITDNLETYMVYDVKNLAASEPFYCGVNDELIEEQGLSKSLDLNTNDKAGDCTFRTYRLAIATTAEYSAALGVTTTAQTLAKVVTTMNRVNGVYEAEVAVRMILINNTDQLFYYDANTDPYTNGSGSTMLGENQTNIDNVIGTANYDIGHVFSTGGGGVAYLNVPCNSSNKAKGVTGRNNPQGDAYDIDYVAHEMGHQFGATHTFNNSCSNNITNSTAYEPGSGSTIMAYAGICSPNVQNNSDAYFHAASIQQIGTFVTGSGDVCDTPINTFNNSAPTVSAGIDYTIPKSTPFILTATGSDPNGDNLYYCWEQWDNEVATMSPVSTSTTGPAFRSLFPDNTPSRYFPELTDVISGTSDTWEVLPSVSRNLDFIVTLRDFHNGTNASGGCTDEDYMTVTVDGNSGPFLVTNPNTANTHYESEQVTVTWDVANTNSSPVSCSNVDILLSYDGGNTYPVTLANNTANDGTQAVTIPSGTSTTARIMIMCSNNIFYDISDTDFIIDAAAVPDYTMSATPSSQSTCTQQTASFTVNTSGVGGYSDNISLSVTGAPAASVYAFSPSTVSPGSSSTLSFTNLSGVTPGTYTLTIMANSTSGTKQTTVDLTVNAAPSQAILSAPANGATDQLFTPTLMWSTVASATDYDIEIATDQAFSNIIESGTTSNTSYTLTTSLSSFTDYYWRVKGRSTCDGAWSSSFHFKTIACVNFSGSSFSIPNSGTNTDTYSVTETGTIKDVDIDLSGTHTYINDLTFNLIHPDNTSVELFSNICSSEDDFNVSFDDQASLTYASLPCPPTSGLRYQPSGNLSAFNNKSMTGNWTLEVIDSYTGDSGQVSTWDVRICATGLALPITWLGFSAKAQDTYIQLDWSTANELGNKGFDIERSTDGINFETIAWQDGNEYTSKKSYYAYEDNDAKSGVLYYYRLKQYDLDGSFTYSDIQTAMIKNEQGGVSVYPNPANDLVNIEMDITNKQELDFFLYDAFGSNVAHYSLKQQLVTIPLNQLAAGIYFYKIYNNRNIISSSKLIIE